MVDTTPKPFVFVLMPFDKSFDDVYQLGIKKACDDVDAYAERIDEQIFQESILQRIYNQISKADVIIADMTGRNPNVFYETGYAHALGKQVILLTQDVNDIPFDLKHYPHIVYQGSIVKLIPELGKKVKWAIEHASTSETWQEPLVQFYWGDKSLANAPTFDCPLEHPGFVHFIINCHNPDDKELRFVQLQVLLLTTGTFVSCEFAGRVVKTIPMSQNGFIHVLPSYIELLPGGWESFNVQLSGQSAIPGKVETITLRALTSQGGYDYPFTLNLKYPQKKGAS